MDADDLELFERSIRSATETHTGAALDAALVDLGWQDALEVDPEAAVTVLFERQGAANASSAAVDRVVLDAVGVGHGDVGVVLPALGGSTPPGELRDGRLTVTGLGSAALGAHDEVLVVARSDGKDVAVVVPTDALERRPIEGIDPWLGLVEVVAESIDVDGVPSPVPGWDAAVALAQVAIGYELVGAAATTLELARQHALERIQFGQPIAKFQAVRHRLAETLIAIETARALLDATWLAGSPGTAAMAKALAGRGGRTAAMAKALAGRGGRTAARHGQQVLAGIGFTTEHDLHRSVRRILVLDELFGAARTLTRELGDELLATRQLPPLLPL